MKNKNIIVAVKYAEIMFLAEIVHKGSIDSKAMKEILKDSFGGKR